MCFGYDTDNLKHFLAIWQLAENLFSEIYVRFLGI